MRHVIAVNNDIAGERYAIPFDTEAEARAQVLAVLSEINKGSHACILRDLDNDWLIEDEVGGQVWCRVFVLPEGSEGVWIGFDSGSRDNFADVLPGVDPQPDDTYGDGDAYLFRTVGQPSGQRVGVSEVR